MALTLTTSLSFIIKDDASQFGKIADAVTDEAHDEVAVGIDEVANGVTDQALGLGAITTVEALAIVSDQTVTIKFNGEPVTGKAFYMRGAAVTSLSVSNASGSKATVRYQMMGT